MNIIDNIKASKGTVTAVAYARFSSEMQRDESIDAQMRAIEEYANRNDIVLVGQYIDKAQSAKTANREQFQRMIRDSKQEQFDVVLVHKLDRFARSRADSMYYRMELKKNKVSLISVLEYIDDSPESIILESVLEAMAEYYSKNLAREVMKGLKENARQGKHTGGTPPLGYDVDSVTKKFVINPYEAEAVKLIYTRQSEGVGYQKIVEELNEKGYRTKFGHTFCTNSIYEILRNERYTGTVVYNQCISRDEFGRRNRHRYKAEQDIIKVENAFPAIISKDLFNRIQKQMNQRKKVHSNRAKETYLLTGKIVCGVCGGHFVGIRKFNSQKRLYTYYTCNIRHRHEGKCDNGCISRDTLEEYVLKQIKHIVFDDNVIADVTKEYNRIIQQTNNQETTKALEKEIESIDKELSRIGEVISVTSSATLFERLNLLETRKYTLQNRIQELNISLKYVDETKVRRTLTQAKQRWKSDAIAGIEQIIDLFIDKIIIDKEDIKVYFNTLN